MTAAGASILIKGLYKTYTSGQKRVEVLRGLDLTVEGGQSIAVVGASGVGKSTLLYIIGALEQASAGQVVVDGVELMGLKEGALAVFRNKTVGFVFQFHHLLADFSAIENVMMPGLIAGLPRAEARTRALELLEAVGLKGLEERGVGQLSGGEQQRVAVARALVMRPKVVLADEPTGNLDEATAERVGRVLVELNREMGTTLVVATHNMALAAMMQRRVRLVGGRAEEMDQL